MGRRKRRGKGSVVHTSRRANKRQMSTCALERVSELIGCSMHDESTFMREGQKKGNKMLSHKTRRKIILDEQTILTPPSSGDNKPINGIEQAAITIRNVR